MWWKRMELTPNLASRAATASALLVGMNGESPAKLTPSQRRELTALLGAGPAAAGYATGCWTTLLSQDLILRRFGVPAA